MVISPHQIRGRWVKNLTMGGVLGSVSSAIGTNSDVLRPLLMSPRTYFAPIKGDVLSMKKCETGPGLGLR